MDLTKKGNCSVETMPMSSVTILNGNLSISESTDEIGENCDSINFNVVDKKKTAFSTALSTLSMNMENLPVLNSDNENKKFRSSRQSDNGHLISHVKKVTNNVKNHGAGFLKDKSPFGRLFYYRDDNTEAPEEIKLRYKRNKNDVNHQRRYKWNLPSAYDRKGRVIYEETIIYEDARHSRAETSCAHFHYQGRIYDY
ncbi:hypothetical protein GJ496_007302 [Pomphorhynchus laevis]|nr:hypothetical protein GJ496_007302 [Pomphorhynchus laevis]